MNAEYRKRKRISCRVYGFSLFISLIFYYYSIRVFIYCYSSLYSILLLFYFSCILFFLHVHILKVQMNAEYKKYSENSSEFHRILQVIYTNVDDSYI